MQDALTLATIGASLASLGAMLAVIFAYKRTIRAIASSQQRIEKDVRMSREETKELATRAASELKTSQQDLAREFDEQIASLKLSLNSEAQAAHRESTALSEAILTRLMGLPALIESVERLRESNLTIGANLQAILHNTTAQRAAFHERIELLSSEISAATPVILPAPNESVKEAELKAALKAVEARGSMLRKELKRLHAYRRDAEELITYWRSVAQNLEGAPPPNDALK